MFGELLIEPFGGEFIDEFEFLALIFGVEISFDTGFFAFVWSQVKVIACR